MLSLSLSRPVALGLMLGLAGCGKPGAARPKPAHALPPSPLVATSEPGVPGGRFLLAIPNSPRTFNPRFVADDAIVRLLFSSLINLDWVTQEPGPGLAETWSVAPDQKTWTFKLRQGVRWSDGVPLTADDVVFTWNDVMYQPEPNPSPLDPFRIGGKSFAVTNLDDYTVRVGTPEIYAPFLEVFGVVPVLPKHILHTGTPGP